MNCLFHRISDAITKPFGAALSVADPVVGGVRMRGTRAGGPVPAVGLPVAGLGVISPMSGTGALGSTIEHTGQPTQ